MQLFVFGMWCSLFTFDCMACKIINWNENAYAAGLSKAMRSYLTLRWKPPHFGTHWNTVFGVVNSAATTYWRLSNCNYILLYCETLTANQWKSEMLTSYCKWLSWGAVMQVLVDKCKFTEATHWQLKDCCIVKGSINRSAKNISHLRLRFIKWRIYRQIHVRFRQKSKINVL